MAKGKRQKKIRSLKRQNKGLNKELDSRLLNASLHIERARKRCVRIENLKAKVNLAESANNYHVTRLDIACNERSIYKFAAATSGCVIFTLICVIIYLLG